MSSSSGSPAAGPSPPSGTAASAEHGRFDILLVVLVGILWGSAFPLIRAGILAGAPPLLFASVRYLLTAAVLLPIAFLSGSPRPTAASLRWPALFGGLFMVGIYGGLLYLGEVSTSGGLAAILTASAPLASALFGYGLLPTERLGRGTAAGLVVGFGGVGVLLLPQLGHPLTSGVEGPVLVVGAVLAFSLGSVFLRRTSSAVPGFWSLAVQFAVAGVFVGALALANGEPLELGQGPIVPLSLAFLIFITGVVGYTLYFRIHHRSGPTRANLVGYVIPVTGLLVGVLAFGESVTAIEPVGLLLIALGLFLVQRDRRASAPSGNP
jgi:drug/metabolite transporter (DMT)-like permease